VFAFTATRPGLALAFTDRHGGVSTGPWESLNLGTSNGDAPERVARNHDLVADAFGVDRDAVVRMSQVHGDVVHVAVDATGEVPVADALVTTTPDLALLVRVADCVPLVLADPAAGVAGVVHAGRQGLVRRVVPAAVAAMRELGATDLTAWIGPRVCGRCYEVPDDLRAEVASVVPQSWAETSWGTPALDVGAGVAAQLEELDVATVDVAGALGRRETCTIESDRLFSYRRQGQRSGRLGALVRLGGDR
jgi:YfiH family protein